MLHESALSFLRHCRKLSQSTIAAVSPMQLLKRLSPPGQDSRTLRIKPDRGAMQYKQSISPGWAVCDSIGAYTTVRPSRACLYDTVAAGVCVPSRYSEPRLSTPSSLRLSAVGILTTVFFTLTRNVGTEPQI